MSKQEIIFNLFNELSTTKQVELLTSLYYELDDFHRDQFLKETENA